MTEASVFFLGAIWDNLITEPNGFWVVLGALGLLCWRFRRVPWPALIPVFMFMALYCFNEAWNLVPQPPPVGHYSQGEFVPFDESQDLALSAALKVANDLIAPAAELQGAQNAERLRVAVIDPENEEAYKKAAEAYTGGIFASAVKYVTVAAVVAVLAMRMFGVNFAAFAFMLVVLAGAEWYTALVNWLGCGVLLEDTSATDLHRTWGQTVSTAVCEREVGKWFEVVGMLLFVGLMWWILERYTSVLKQARKLSQN